MSSTAPNDLSKSGLISIDPGVHACGVALWSSGKLLKAQLVSNRGEEWDTMGKAVRAWADTEQVPLSGIIEFPQWYPHSKKDVDPNDLIRLAGAAGSVVGAFPETNWRTVLPRQWKNQVPKQIMVERIKTKVSESEARLVVKPWPESLEHNVWDAVGLGLFRLGRL